LSLSSDFADILSISHIKVQAENFSFQEYPADLLKISWPIAREYALLTFILVILSYPLVFLPHMLINFLLPLASDPEVELERISVRNAAVIMMSSTMRWLKENAGEERFALFRQVVWFVTR